MISSTAPNVNSLWSRLEEMEKEGRFAGQAYPIGMSSFPFHLKGQGFFPGGDGMWRENPEEASSFDQILPTRGIVFLGNDFGTLNSYQRLEKRSYENPPTWRHVKERIRRARLPEKQTFFTNATLGLRSSEGAKALGKRATATEPLFTAFCKEFFIYQIEILQPRLIVILGPAAGSTLNSFGVPGTIAGNNAIPVTIGNHTTSLHKTCHPYGDFRFTEPRKDEDALILQRAWEHSA